MTNAMRAEAKASGDDKLRRMGLKVTTADMGDTIDGAQIGPAADGSAGVAKVGYADDFRAGDKVVAHKAKTTNPIEGKKSKGRLDRPGYARGGSIGKAKGKGTTVNGRYRPAGVVLPRRDAGAAGGDGTSSAVAAGRACWRSCAASGVARPQARWTCGLRGWRWLW